MENSINTRLETDVRKIVRQEQDRNRRRLNLIAYGVPLQTNDAQFISTYLKDEYSINVGAITNLKRLPNGKNTSTIDRPNPILFSINDYKIKMDILKASRERRGSISFFADASNEDHQRRKELIEEIRRCAAAGEKKPCHP